MPEVLAIETREGAPLDRRSTDRLWLRAHRAAARVTVTAPSACGEKTWTGVILGCHGPFLSIKPDLPAEPMASSGSASIFQVQMELGGVAYDFETRPIHPASEWGPGVMHVERPRNIRPTDRRRSPRRSLRQPTPVTLHATPDDPPWRCEAVMLNVSADGLACRVTLPIAQRLTIGETLRAGFTLDASSARFDLPGRISNITEGAPGHVVIGLAFAADDRSAPHRRRLHDTLEGAAEAETGRFEP